MKGLMHIKETYKRHKAYGLVGCLATLLFTSGTVEAAVINGGRDINAIDAHASDNSGVAMTYTRFDAGSSKQTASGSGVFIAPNVMVTVAHNYLDKNRETGAGFVRGGDSAQSHVVMNSNSEKRNGVPADGVDQLVEKGDIHYYNQNELGKSYTNDLAVVVLPKPVEAMTHGEDTYRTIGTVKQGDAIRLVGYPNDFSSKNLSSDARNTLKDGKLYEVRGIISELNSNGEGKYHMSALGGFSGGPVFNNAGQLVGIHQHGTNSDAIPEDQQYGAGLFFTEAHKAWLKEMVDKYAIKGWYVDGNDKYYYDDTHQPVKNEERTIDGARYRFDAQGRGTLISGKETGRVVLRAVDKQGNLLFERVVGTGQVGSGFTYDFKSDKNNQAYFVENLNATVVSIDTESIGKKFNEQWDKDFASKYQLGNTMIKVVIDGGREFSRTVDNSGSSVKPPVTNDKKPDHGKLVEIDDQSWLGWMGELYEDGTYVMKGVPGRDVNLNNPNYGNGTMFGGDPAKLGKIKRFIVDGKLVADQFDLGTAFHPTEIDLTGLTLTNKSTVPFLVYKLTDLTTLTFDKNFKLNRGSSLTRFIDGAPKLKLTNDQVTQLLSDLALTVANYNGPLFRNVGVERLDLSTFDNSKIDPTKYMKYKGSDENGKSFVTKAIFKDLIGLKEIVFGDKFDFGNYGRKNTPNAFLDTDLSKVEKVTLAGNKDGNDKFVKDWLIDVQTLNDTNKQGLYRDGKYVGTISDALNIDKTYEDGVYTLGPIMNTGPEKPADNYDLPTTGTADMTITLVGLVGTLVITKRKKKA